MKKKSTRKKPGSDITEDSVRNANFAGQIDAINRSQSVIEFDLDGTILSANENFLSMMGYGLDEISGKHHSIFADPEFAASEEYKEFWAALGRGEFQAAEFKRLGKNGREVWIQASYNPILDRDGTPYKVVKFATDITEDSVRNANFAGQIDAINRSQSVIEFDLDGTILSANENFLSMMGYGLDEISGKHHSIFADPEFAASEEYKEFWAALGRGEFQAAEFKRLGKNGRDVWIQASYNPILDRDGNPHRVVKFATDVTERKMTEAMIASQSVIEFDLDGTVLSANENFLSMMEYDLDEITGKHHSIFVDPVFAASGEYKEFWAALRRGEDQVADFKRLGKNDKEVWVQASYTPFFDRDGKPYKVVKFATDVTERKAAEARIESQQLAIMEMATPVTAIWKDILMLPIVGFIDSRRAQDVMAAVLTKIEETRARVFILDISGVAMVDTAVANHMIKITKATKLMGCECMISGLSPAISQTIVDLGIETGEIKTSATLRDALEAGFHAVGVQVRIVRDQGG